jgi:hypothetical protein
METFSGEARLNSSLPIDQKQNALNNHGEKKMSQSVIGIVPTEEIGSELVAALRDAGHTYDEVSVLFPDRQGTQDFAHRNSTKAPEGAVAGVAAGGILGSALGLAAGVGALAIPGCGPLIAAGQIMAALSGAAIGATVAGIGGALVGLGIPEYEARMYEDKVKNGNILVACHCHDSEQVKTAEEAFKRYNASDIHHVHEDRAPRR